MKPVTLQNDLPYNEQQVLQRIAEGAHDAFAALFDRYKDNVFHAASLYTKDPAVAEEIVQEVFLKVWTSRHQLPGIADFRSWLFILARNQVIKYLEKWANNKAIEWKWVQSGEQLQDSEEARLQLELYARLLEEAVQNLPPQQQQVFKLAKEQRLSYDAIARELQLSPLTVKTHMQRALRSIRHWLQRHSELCAILFMISMY